MQRIGRQALTMINSVASTCKSGGRFLTGDSAIMARFVFAKGGCVTMAENVAIEDYPGFAGGGEPC